jgi:hypothetical protein
MIRQAKHDRQLSDETHSRSVLIRWLNETRNKEAKARVSELLRLCTSAREISNATTMQNFEDRDDVFVKLGRLEREINRISSRYVGARRITCVFAGIVFAPWESVDRYRASEFHSVDCLLNLFELDVLSRVRICDCGRYFYARSTLSRFCCKSCRELFWENSEMRKNQKRKKAREYYWLHKNKNVK